MGSDIRGHSPLEFLPELPDAHELTTPVTGVAISCMAQKKKNEVYSRPAWERMMRMHQLIQNGEYPNCPKVAKEFEVSTRTVKRDVDFMKTRLKLPIEYDENRYGFFYTQPVDQFPTVAV